MEMRSEINLFHEVRGYLGEMQQQLAQVSQEDYGAGLRIKELEAIITREREVAQNMVSVISQETHQECNELRERGDRIFRRSLRSNRTEGCPTISRKRDHHRRSHDAEETT